MKNIAVDVKPHDMEPASSDPILLLRDWGTYVVGGMSILVGLLVGVFGRFLAVMASTSTTAAQIKELEKRIDFISARVDNNMQELADLRVAVAGLPGREEQRNQFAALTRRVEELSYRGGHPPVA